MTRIGRPLQILAFAISVVGLVLTAAAPANAATNDDPSDAGIGVDYCYPSDEAYLDAGPASASVHLSRCSGSQGNFWGTVSDEACDGRSAVLEITSFGSNGLPIGYNAIYADRGCGTWESYNFMTGPFFAYAHVQVWACSTWGCSSSDSAWLW